MLGSHLGAIGETSLKGKALTLKGISLISEMTKGPGCGNYSYWVGNCQGPLSVGTQ